MSGELIGTVIPAAGRNPGEEYGCFHLYKYVEHKCDEVCLDTLNASEGAWRCDEVADLLPMCIYGWNRSNGFGFSILRNNTLACRECRLCRKNVNAGKPPTEPREHRTAWL